MLVTLAPSILCEGNQLAQQLQCEDFQSPQPKGGSKEQRAGLQQAPV